MDGGDIERNTMSSTFMLGAEKVYDTSKAIPMPAKDKKGRQLWKLPKPIRFEDHFKNAAKARKVRTGEIELHEGIQSVPIYRGLDRRVYMAMKRQYVVNLRREKEKEKEKQANESTS